MLWRGRSEGRDTRRQWGTATWPQRKHSQRREVQRRPSENIGSTQKRARRPGGWVALEGTGNQLRAAVQGALDHDKGFGICPLWDGKRLEADEYRGQCLIWWDRSPSPLSMEGRVWESERHSETVLKVFEEWGGRTKTSRRGAGRHRGRCDSRTTREKQPPCRRGQSERAQPEWDGSLGNLSGGLHSGRDECNRNDYEIILI